MCRLMSWAAVLVGVTWRCGKPQVTENRKRVAARRTARAGNPRGRVRQRDPGEACHFSTNPGGVDLFFSGSRRGSEARVPSIRRARNASPDMFAAKSSSVCHMRWTAHPFSGSEVTYVPSLLGCALTHPSDEDKYVTSDPENGRAVHLK